METKSYIWRISLLLNVTVLFVFILSFFSDSVEVLHRFDFLYSIKSTNSTYSAAENHVDSNLIDSAQSEIVAINNFENKGYLDLFFDALIDCQSSGKKVHIAFFGDSMIEGDLLTAEFRRKMQSKFGGNGVGFVPITSIVSGFRNTIRHDFNDGWQTFGFADASKQSFPLGPSGQLYIGQPEAEVHYKSSEYPFNKGELILNKKSQGEISIFTDQHLQKTITLSPSINSASVIPIFQGPYRSIDIKCNQGNPVLYGTNFESGPGCYVDNFGYRGSSGTALSCYNTELMNEISDALNYKLVVLQFGLNVIGKGVMDYSNYQKSMERTIVHLKECFPNASFLFIGMTDKGINQHGTWTSDPAVTALLRHQNSIAQNQQMAYFSFYDAMGGEGSMVSWVKDSVPALANKDYTHPTYRGANILADSLFAYISRSYDHYVQKKSIK